MDHRKARKIFWICWLLASVVIVVLGAMLPDEKMQKAVITIGIIIVHFRRCNCNLFYEMSLL